MRSIIWQVGLALPSHHEIPSLLQRSHSQTETHVHGEIVRLRIAGRAGRAVGEIKGQCHQRNESRVGAIHSPVVVQEVGAVCRGQRKGNCDASQMGVGA